MLHKIIKLSIKNKLIVLLITLGTAVFGLYSLTQISIGAVPDITNNQVQVITTSRNLSTQDVEQFITYPVELEMANLPGVEEIRSISKFGLSVVTVVFNDNMGTYLPRQLIAEKIKSASEKIPEGFGSPEMGPITTGLGEIYQYILDTKPGYKDKYSAMELRTIQDWVVKRQLSGIPGVVEVNTWGGFLKQYEVAINPHKLKSMHIDVSQILEALESNNSVAGGGYIEKSNESYFVRGEGLINSIDDIENIVIKNVDGVPVLIKDVANVNFGHANRFGAITGNGEGEKVLGQIMMLKDGDSNRVIKAVKERVDEIQKTLPEGVFINGFLERSELIGKTTFTIAENLILGILIVIFVVILLLGSFRSGLVVASVIPLSLLFTLSMMNLFGIDANLMSLGAIDFGIIIDGAVIIVEFIAFKIASNRANLELLSKEEKQQSIDELTYTGSSKMMTSAIFGQLIILIVFIPILSLTGVEGKMFKPMALSFSFALIGAMLLCFTYVPVVASLFLKPEKATSISKMSNKIMAFFYRIYKPVIEWALYHKKAVISFSVVLMVVVSFLFSRMGGEFIPTLDEGDFTIQPVLKTGTSLTKTAALTTQMEQILLDNFPEVSQVVSRIGAAEVPTDPMSMEQSDVIVKLKPKSEWVSAKSKDELADKFKEKLSIIPGIDYEFTQPIEMRFNELISGVRADVAIKIYGEDLIVLAKKADEIKSKISRVEGASDIIVEKTNGLPQMTVNYNRKKVARYGLSIETLNNVVSMAFAGGIVGNVFEGERRFDLVVRFDEEHRKSIENLRELYIDTPLGIKIPLNEVANINYTKGPAQISRDNTKRRIVIGVNVRNRDMESVVKDARKIIESEVNLPVGYSVSYGGQFENLNSAKQRLKMAVPIALLLIFILLYFAFHSVKDALMIYSAIPLAAVGGVLFLWMRGLPFSISAGVGFIALFGIAVLNGIVLIEHLKALKEQGVANVYERILRGTKERLRPVILTASAAALGFLPMAISTGAGAEVQRPLATVVIGGLITATILTLVVLPVLYAIFELKKYKLKPKIKSNSALLIFILALPLASFSQQTISLEEAIEIGLKNNKELRIDSLNINRALKNQNSAFNIDKTRVYYLDDKTNKNDLGTTYRTFGVEQSIEFPSIYFARKKANKIKTSMAEINYLLAKNNLTKNISQAYHNIVYLNEKLIHLKYIDSIYQNFANASKRKFELGDANYLEMITAASKYKEYTTHLSQLKNEVTIAYEQLNTLLQGDTSYKIGKKELNKLPVKSMEIGGHLANQFFTENTRLQKANKGVESQQLLPNLDFNYFNSRDLDVSKSFNSFEAGVSVPLFFFGNKSRIAASKIVEDMAVELQSETALKLNAKHQKLLAQLEKSATEVEYFENSGEHLASEILKTATKSYKNGEIDFFEYILSLENASKIKINYLSNLNKYNQIVLEINYLNL